MASDTIELRCNDCGEQREHERRKGVAMGSGAARWRCTDCGHIR